MSGERAALFWVDTDIAAQFAGQVLTEVNTLWSTTSHWILANQSSTGLIHEEYVGVKWNRTRGFRWRSCSTALVLMGGEIIEDDYEWRASH